MDDDHGGPAGVNGDGGVPDRDRHRHSIYMTGVLARALTAQLEEMPRASDDEGWWFARSERQRPPPADDGAGDDGAGDGLAGQDGR